ncbi:MAG TPA: hypothetical protein VNO54_06690 [Streptosporangiaceae bacterium]|nr:hypothetical protein [Streptosporangiaceae bacterium]
MTGAEWAILVPAIAGCLGGLAAWLRAQAAHKKLKALGQPGRRP